MIRDVSRKIPEEVYISLYGMLPLCPTQFYVPRTSEERISSGFLPLVKYDSEFSVCSFYVWLVFDLEHENWFDGQGRVTVFFSRKAAREYVRDVKIRVSAPHRYTIPH